MKHAQKYEKDFEISIRMKRCKQLSKAAFLRVSFQKHNEPEDQAFLVSSVPSFDSNRVENNQSSVFTSIRILFHEPFSNILDSVYNTFRLETRKLLRAFVYNYTRRWIYFSLLHVP